MTQSTSGPSGWLQLFGGFDPESPLIVSAKIGTETFEGLLRGSRSRFLFCVARNASDVRPLRVVYAYSSGGRFQALM